MKMIPKLKMALRMKNLKNKDNLKNENDLKIVKDYTALPYTAGAVIFSARKAL